MRQFGILSPVLTLIASVSCADEPKAKSPAESGKDVFGMTKVWQFHLMIPAKDFQTMQPTGGGFPMFGPPGGPPKTPQKPPDKAVEIHKGGSFGIEYPWGHGEFVADGQTYKNVGLRYKGGGSYLMSANRLKRNIKVDLDRYLADQQFHGLKALNLNSGAADLTRLREALAFAVYRDAGVPTPRTAYAEVTLTVPGKYEKELLGMYTLIEQVDKNFLQDHFKNTNGVLMKPEVRFGNMQGPFAYVGETWDKYNEALKPKNEPSKKDADRIIAFLKLLNRGSDEELRKEVASYLDIDQFLRFLAVTSFLANLDSFFTGGHNAYIYLNPETNKFVFIPWDLDLAFGGFFMFGQPDQQSEFSILRPYPGEHKLVDRLLAIKEISDKYQVILKELAKTAFSKEKLLANLAAVENATKEALAREERAVEGRKEDKNPGIPGLPALNGPPPSLKSFIEKRTSQIALQLEGKSKGKTPAMDFSAFAPPPPAPPKPGDVIPAPAQNALRLTNEQKKKLAEIQKGVDEQIENLLTPDQRAQWKRLREGGPPGGPPPGFPGKEPPKGGKQ